jgi:phytoene dehydrogenase-like protein
MNAKDELPVVIIGSGISGLSCAKSLLGKIPCTILEKDMKPGGRIQSDIYNGYILDRGFQIFIDSYPYVQDNQIIDKESLELKPFLPGALIYTGNSFCRISDPLRKPDELFNTLFSPVGTFSDKLKVGI